MGFRFRGARTTTSARNDDILATCKVCCALLLSRAQTRTGQRKTTSRCIVCNTDGCCLSIDRTKAKSNRISFGTRPTGRRILFCFTRFGDRPPTFLNTFYFDVFRSLLHQLLLLFTDRFQTANAINRIWFSNDGNVNIFFRLRHIGQCR